MTSVSLKKTAQKIFTILLLTFSCSVIFLNCFLWFAKNKEGKIYKKISAATPEIKFGLDIVGGSQLLLEIELENDNSIEVYESLIAGIKNILWDIKLPYQKIEKIPHGLDIEVIENPAKNNLLLKNIKALDPNLSIKEISGSKFILSYNKKATNMKLNQAVESSMKIIRKRVDESGTGEIVLQKFGNNKIILQMPGIEDPNIIKNKLGKVAKLTFHLLDTQNPIISKSKAQKMNNSKRKFLGGKNLSEDQVFNVIARPAMSGESLVDARVEAKDMQAMISFRLNKEGARRFREITSQNQGRPLAIVLDDFVLTAPRINDTIPNGIGTISGGFMPKEAEELASLLRSGALPAKINLIEERTIGPSAGQKTIENAKNASIIGTALVVLFMIIYYKRLGLIAGITIILNLVIALSIMAVFGVTLSLAGIAGLILTLGMSVDANVLIYERMRDEFSKGAKFNNENIIKNGFNGALVGIIDSNITTILSAMTMLFFGSGFIKGFAISLILGILSSLFSCVFLTKILALKLCSKQQVKLF